MTTADVRELAAAAQRPAGDDALVRMERLATHMQAAFHAHGEPITKGESFYLGALAVHGPELVRRAEAHGYHAELCPGGLGGVALTLRKRMPGD